MKLLKIVPFLLATILWNCTKDSATTNIGFQNQTDFIKTYGGTKNESGNSIVNTVDGGYAILGYAQSMDGDITDKQNESFDYWVLKFDAESHLQWSKTYGGSSDDRGNRIIQTVDGGYVILGYTQSTDQDVTENAGFQDYWLVKLNAQGDILWEKSFGYAGADIGISLIQTTDSGYLLVGVLDVTASNGQGNTSRSYRHAGGDFWAIKLDASANLQWSKYYGGTFTDTAYDVIQTAAGNYMIVGSSDSSDVDITNNLGTYDYWVVKIDSQGTMLWEKSFGGNQIDEAKAITSTSDGNFLIAGTTRSENQDITNNLGAADVWIIKISSSGELLSEKTFGGSSFDSGLHIKKTPSGFLVSGNTRSSTGDVISNNGQNDAWIFKIDHNLNLMWSNTVGSSAIDTYYAAIELENNQVIAVGETSGDDFDIEENKGFTDLLITKIK